MTPQTCSAEFWQMLERLLSTSRVVIDRPKGCAHPKYPEMIYPLDYGYLENTSSMDAAGIDLWRGSLDRTGIQAVLVTVDLWKRDSEIKLLIGLTEDETETVCRFTNKPGVMACLLIRREA